MSTAFESTSDHTGSPDSITAVMLSVASPMFVTCTGMIGALSPGLRNVSGNAGTAATDIFRVMPRPLIVTIAGFILGAAIPMSGNVNVAESPPLGGIATSGVYVTVTANEAPAA